MEFVLESEKTVVIYAKKMLRRGEILNLVNGRYMFIEILLKRFNCDTVNYLCWENIANIHDSIEGKLFRFIQSKTLTNDLEAIVTDGACEIGSYIVVYVNIFKTMENF